MPGRYLQHVPRENTVFAPFSYLDGHSILNVFKRFFPRSKKVNGRTEEEKQFRSVITRDAGSFTAKKSLYQTKG
jgi:hypothetical protein